MQNEINYEAGIRALLEKDIKKARQELEKYYDISEFPTPVIHREYAYILDDYKDTSFKALYRIKINSSQKQELILNPEYLIAQYGSAALNSLRISPDNKFLALKLDGAKFDGVIMCDLNSSGNCRMGPEQVHDYQWAGETGKILFTRSKNLRADQLLMYDPTTLKETLIRKAKDDKENIQISVPGAAQVPDSFSDPTIPNTYSKILKNTGQVVYLGMDKLSPQINYHKDNYKVLTFQARSKDTTQIPITIAKRTTLKSPYAGVILSVYGAYGKKPDTRFKPENLYLMNQGYILAFAHVRGGAGPDIDWHEKGRGRYKYKTIEDTLAASERLRQIYPGLELILYGRSAGALAASQAALAMPELYDALILENPFLDIAAYLKRPDGLTEREKAEWGNPALLPINIDHSKRFPPTLILAAALDKTIHLSQPLSLLSRIRQAGQNNFALLHISESAAHEGEVLQYREIEEKAFLAAFISQYQNIR